MKRTCLIPGDNFEGKNTRVVIHAFSSSQSKKAHLFCICANRQYYIASGIRQQCESQSINNSRNSLNPKSPFYHFSLLSLKLCNTNNSSILVLVQLLHKNCMYQQKLAASKVGYLLTNQYIFSCPLIKQTSCNPTPNIWVPIVVSIISKLFQDSVFLSLHVSQLRP